MQITEMTSVAAFAESDYVEEFDNVAIATRTALSEIDGELEAVTATLASLRSRELLLRAARYEVMRRSSAAGAVEKFLEVYCRSLPVVHEGYDIGEGTFFTTIEKQLDEHIEGILSVAERVGA